MIEGKTKWNSPLASNEGRGISFAQYEYREAYVGVIACLQVESTSGEVRVPRIIVANDCRLIINPDGLRNQIAGVDVN